MKLIDKLKNMFTEEIEEEEIKKEVMKVEIPAPAVKKEEKKAEVKRENRIENKLEIEKKEEKFVFPVYFDDKDFDDLEKKEEIKLPKKENKIDSISEKISSNYKGGKKDLKKEEIKTEKKTFKPTPIISPIYGILDKNYTKDDVVVNNKEVINYYKESENVTIDDVRAKAYGSLEDELENTLFGETSVLFGEDMGTSSNDEEKDIFADLEGEDPVGENGFDNSINDIISKYDAPIGKEEVENDYPKRKKSYDDLNKNDFIDNNINDENNEIDDDLFNLIDSMYEKEDE